MKSLQRCWTILRGYLKPAGHVRPNSGTATELSSPDDLLARFLFQKNHFKRMENRATPLAFMPPPDLQLSVFLIADLSINEIWELGKRALTEHPQPSLYGRADIQVAAVQEQKLRAFRDDDPPRHVNVVGWPNYADGKDLIKSIAQELARNSSLML